MLYLLVGLGALIILGLSALAMRHLEPAKNQDWQRLAKQREELLEELREALPTLSPADEHKPACEHPAAREVWQALAEGKPAEALAMAEIAMANDRSNPNARLLLALGLLAHQDYAAAAAQLQAGLDLGEETPLATYLAGRIEIEQYLDSLAGPKKHSGAILMPVELLALELVSRLGSSNDATALWMPGQGEVSQDEAREFALVHFGAYYRILGDLLSLAKEQPSRDVLYHLGRLALKCGFSEEGGRVLSSLDGLMEESEFKRSYERLMAQLRGESPVAVEANLPRGRKGIKLKVLN